jgi:SsrA-binding protein
MNQKAPSSSPKKEHIVPICQNRRASFDYFIEKKFEAGIELVGSEVKACREGKVQLVDSFASIEKDECFLHKAHISEYKHGGPHFNHPPVRRRKLLLRKREIRNLEALLEQKGYTLVPIRMYFKNGKAKVELGLGKGKTKGDKRETVKQREDTVQMNQAVKRRPNPRSSSFYDD